MNFIMMVLFNINAAIVDGLVYMHNAGLSSFWDSLRKDWIGPIFFAAVAIFSVVFIKDRAWMKLLSFIGIAAVVGVLVFLGSSFFGDGGSITDFAEKEGSGIFNTVVVSSDDLAGPLDILN